MSIRQDAGGVYRVPGQTLILSAVTSWGGGGGHWSGVHSLTPYTVLTRKG